MKMLVTGASGLVGAAVTAQAGRDGHEVTALAHGWREVVPGACRCIQVDLEDAGALKPLLEEAEPDVVVNAAAVSEPSACEAEPERSERINISLPAALARWCDSRGVRLLHFSTDQVFDGNRGDYRPTDEARPVSLYGRQKRASELAVLEASRDAVIVRAPLLTGNSPRGNRSVHEKLFELWRQGKKARLFVDEIRQPCSAASLAGFVLAMGVRPRAGLWHWAGQEALSRYEIGRRIAEHFGRMPEQCIEPASLREDLRFAQRPPQLTLDISQSLVVGLQPEAFEDQLRGMHGRLGS